MRLRSTYVTMIAALVISLMVPAFANAQGGRANFQRNPLMRLNRALQSAGAAPLDSNQQQQLNSLISDYRAAQPRGNPDAALQSARHDLENAILAKDEAGMTTAAGKIATEISNQASSTIQDRGKFEIQALSILSSDQVAALKNQIGDAGLIRILGSVAGGQPNMNRAAMTN